MSWGSSELERRHGTPEGGGSTPSPSTITLAGHQPVYLPGIIVMAKIAAVDQFMWAGHCDYQPRSFHSRNYIRGSNGKRLALTVPVVSYSGPSINEKIIDGTYWTEKHLKSIKQSYSGRPYFKDYFPELEAVLLDTANWLRWRANPRHDPPTLGSMNVCLASLFCHWLAIDTAIHFSENWNIEGHKTAMLVDMCDKLRVTDYLSSPGETYVVPGEMNGYHHHFQKFTHPVYDQGARDFVPNLSVIDLVFNCGPRSSKIVRECGHE